MATKVFAVAAVLGAAGGTMFLSSRSATASGFSGPFSGGTQKDTTLSTSERLCLNGTTCSVYLQYDGGTVGVVGAELETPQGFYASQNVNADTIITPQAVISQAASGQKAFGVAIDGARTYFGESGNVYCYNNAGEVTCASAWKIPTVSTDTIGSFTSNRYTDMFRVRFFPTAVGNLGTCNGVAAAGSNPEGLTVAITGASLSGQTRICTCVSDGAGTPAYTWINMGCPNTAGTSTTCPACP
jgi:hypothetical protein